MATAILAIGLQEQYGHVNSAQMIFPQSIKPTIINYTIAPIACLHLTLWVQKLLPCAWKKEKKPASANRTQGGGDNPLFQACDVASTSKRRR
jgi:hypothetical protein